MPGGGASLIVQINNDTKEEINYYKAYKSTVVSCFTAGGGGVVMGHFWREMLDKMIENHWGDHEDEGAKDNDNDFCDFLFPNGGSGSSKR